METPKNLIRHCGLDPQSPENNAFNKGMLKQVTHDGLIYIDRIITNNLIKHENI